MKSEKTITLALLIATIVLGFTVLCHGSEAKAQKYRWYRSADGKTTVIIYGETKVKAQKHRAPDFYDRARANYFNNRYGTAPGVIHNPNYRSVPSATPATVRNPHYSPLTDI